ncbi:MAG: leucyl aminopeptidase [Gemmatimonadales bacterium]|nr:MAG: leucyl aminopeptidase [Gemmatimonadales bacterium]
MPVYLQKARPMPCPGNAARPTFSGFPDRWASASPTLPRGPVSTHTPPPDPGSAMRLHYLAASPWDQAADLLALVIFQQNGDEGLDEPALELDRRLGGLLRQALDDGDFRGREEDRLDFFLPGATPGPRRAVILGGGKVAEADADLVRRCAGRAVRAAESRSLTRVHFVLPDRSHLPASIPDDVAVQAAAEGLGLAAWDFRELKGAPSSPESAPPPLLEEGWVHAPWEGSGDVGPRAVEVAAAVVAGQNLARDLQWRPGNIATPTHLAEVAQELGREHGLAVRILGPAEMEEERMGALLSVARGSDQEPRLMVLEHRGGGDEAPLALVGKGLTFDSGGISLKPAAGMEDMKYDMSGGAAVLGAMKTVAMLDLPVNVVGVVPSSENLVNGSANKPGDVVTTRAGKTVEIINTDAEGRLILCDALSWVVDHHAPQAVVDCATLTGACVTALGHHAAAVMGTDETLIDQLRSAGDASGERCWPLPLWKAYRKQLESPVADLKNVGGRPAGSITAGWFLAEFVGDTPWAHLDIAGTAYGTEELPYQRKGGFGFPTRLLVEWVRSRADRRRS